MIFIRIYKTTGQRRRVLLVGAGKAGQTLAELYGTLGTRSFNLMGFIDDDETKIGKNIMMDSCYRFEHRIAHIDRCLSYFRSGNSHQR